MSSLHVGSFELLLLDTTEKEGEDNKLFYTYESLHNADAHTRATTWSDLRGVYAAAMGTMISVVGEPLSLARFKMKQNGEEKVTLVGSVNMNETLYVMVFVDCELPKRIVRYYTRSSCELMVSVLGYPGEKLKQWHQNHRSCEETFDTRLTRICQHIFRCIRRDLRLESHVHFAFAGCPPIVNYPLELLARLSAFQVIESRENCFSVVGVAMFYRKSLIVARTRPDVIALINQWFLGDEFDTEAATGDDSTLSLFSWFDPHFSLCGIVNATHCLVRIRHGDVQCFYMLRHSFSNEFQPLVKDPQSIISTEDLDELLHFINTRVRLQYDKLLDAQRKAITPGQPLWYSIVVDKIRHVVHGMHPCEIFTSSPDIEDTSDGHWRILLKQLIVQSATAFESSKLVPLSEASRPEVTSNKREWVPPVKLDTQSDEKLLLLPVRPEDDSGADLSSEEAQIFPPIFYQLEEEAQQRPLGGMVEQEAMQLRLDSDSGDVEDEECDGQFIWVIASYYETYDGFSVCDDGASFDLLDKNFETLTRVH